MQSAARDFAHFQLQIRPDQHGVDAVAKCARMADLADELVAKFALGLDQSNHLDGTS